ncbi:MAG: two-component system response regulator CreB [Spirochaetes bacterium]|nr:two-component system response regulator CreB [Spirochaetota bacterium]
MPEKQTILIIEDEPGIADTVTYALEREGFLPLWAPTGAEGMARLDSGGVDLVILDIGLPDISGFDLVKAIRKRSAMPLLVLTARSGEIDRVLGLELGADDYIVKPFSPRELVARVRAVLRRSGGDNNTAVPGSASFSIDAERRQITYRGERLDLARYEYEILCLLIRRPGWVFTREKIMEMVWIEPDESFERTVDTHIKTIRAKLRAVDPGTDPIMTHRGVGYSLREGL